MSSRPSHSKQISPKTLGFILAGMAVLAVIGLASMKRQGEPERTSVPPVPVYSPESNAGSATPPQSAPMVPSSRADAELQNMLAQIERMRNQALNEVEEGKLSPEAGEQRLAQLKQQLSAQAERTPPSPAVQQRYEAVAQTLDPQQFPDIFAFAGAQRQLQGLLAKNDSLSAAGLFEAIAQVLVMVEALEETFKWLKEDPTKALRLSKAQERARTLRVGTDQLEQIAAQRRLAEEKPREEEAPVGFAARMGSGTKCPYPGCRAGEDAMHFTVNGKLDPRGALVACKYCGRPFRIPLKK